MDIHKLGDQIDISINQHSVNFIEWRRHLHMYPELRFQEFHTNEYITKLLSTLGITPVKVAQTGLVALLEGKKHGPTIALRADMDALPIYDEKNVPYKSSIPGLCHACGHDAHMTIALGVAYILSELRDEMSGCVKVIFQPAEEVPSGEQSGAKAMIAAGVLNDPDVDAIFGLHCWPEITAGQIGLQRGCTMASADSFLVSISGQASHAGTPQNGRDALLAAAQIIQALHLVSAREVSPNEAHSFSIGTIRGGQSQSIVCEKVEMTGTLRTTSHLLRDYLIGRLGDVVKEISNASRCTGYLQVTDSFPSVMNDDYLYEIAKTSLIAIWGADKIVELTERPMTADDFSYYLDKIPGLYLKLGVAPRDKSVPAFSLHNSKFDIDETALLVGVRSLVFLLLSALQSNHLNTMK